MLEVICNCKFVWELVTKMALTFLVMVLFLTSISAQQYSVKGEITDTTANKVIHEASVVLLYAKDSLLVTDTRSSMDGGFSFNNIKKGKYILLVTYPKYVDYVENFSVDSLPTTKYLNKINLTPQAILLKEVVIKYNKVAAIRLKGDTLEFAADSFRVQPNASVEDLLKKLPGLKVDKDGKLTAQGRPIEKVLVDGEEFFGDDPTLVTKNLKANMVDKIQLYEKKSDQSAFTGIDDGKKTKTLNVTTKEDKKHGIFGKIELGLGTKGFYENQALFNSFNGDEKVAGYFTMSNTAKIGLDRRSQESYAGGDGNPISNDLDNWNGTYGGIGIPKSVSGGLHYDNKWNAENQSLNLNYKLGGLNVNGEQNTITQNNLPGNVLYSNSNQQTKNEILRHGLNAAYNIKLDATSDLKFYVEGSYLNKNTNERDSLGTNREDLSLLNNSLKNISTKGTVKAINSNLLWQKRFSKERRTFSVNFNIKANENYNTGNFYTKSNFFDNNSKIDSSQIVDQHKTTSNHAEDYSMNVTYTEPLSKWESIIANYGVSINNAKAELKTFNKASGDVYNVIDSLYSNNYEFNQFSNKMGIAYVLNKKKMRVQIGGDINFNKFDQHNLIDNSIFQRHFTNIFPSAQFRYNLTSYKTISLSYNGYTTQPAIQQLQPVVNNNDPLNLYIGNVTLKPSFSNNFSTSYQYFKNSAYLAFNGNLTFTYNTITLLTQTDYSSGKSINQYTNLSDKTTLSYFATFMYRNRFKAGNFDWGLDGNINGNEYSNFTNGRLNTTNASAYQVNLVFSKAKDALYNVGASIGVNYNINKNSLQPNINNNAFGYTVYPILDFFLPANFQLHTDFNYTWLEKTQTFNSNFNRFIWNASIGKQFLKQKNLLFKISANDILNQNVGFNRTVNNNMIVQNSFTTIARYLMISLIWDFNRMAKRPN